MDKYYITTAIAYTSGKPHIGNVYDAVVADAIARFKKLQGYDVYFQTGTDEHGIKIQEKAEAASVSPKEYVDNISSVVKNIYDMLNIDYDDFMRTTDEDHEKCVQKIFKKMYDKGDIYKGEYNGLYCTPCESFWTESQLVDGKCPDCGREVHPQSEECYFFKLSNYQDKLDDLFKNHSEFLIPESRVNEMYNNFIAPGVQDLCVSRTSFTWGIPVDFDPKHVIYVWLDALTNYITKIGYDPDGSSDKFNKLWPADVHVIGKDIVRFHSIYWPCFLWSLGLELPKKVFGHPWVLSGNDKMSKSKGNVVYPDDLINEFGLDAVRYYLLHEVSQTNDGSITREQLTEKYNTDLANTLGNLVQRTISMGNKYFNGNITNKGVSEDVDVEFKNSINSLYDKVCNKIDKFFVADAFNEIFNVLRLSNKYIDDTTPWVLAKDESKLDRLETVLYNLLESIRVCGLLLYPFIPNASDNIIKQLNNSNKELSVVLDNSYSLTTPEILFKRIEEEK
ncbi:MAG: methionine--tRNA ligase [Bacilli bacterium]|nr:methionine--tRNA ligase [Bacilli bacterium]